MGDDGLMRVTVFGTRGSVPVTGGAFAVFGGATSCYLLEAEGSVLVIDAGTGAGNIGDCALGGGPVTVLLSHVHADHIMGLPFLPAFSESERQIAVYTASRLGMSCREQLDRFFSPPVWPLTLSEYPADVRFFDLSPSLTVGPFTVVGMESSHPGGATVFRITCGGKTVVFATDFEHGPDASRKLAQFARGADIMFYDAQYSDEEYEAHRGYGHSTAHAGLDTAAAAGVKKVFFIHHDPNACDALLLGRERALGTDAARYAREGDVIEI